MDYETGRELIQDGDIVFVLRPQTKASFFAATISFFTGSPVYHCGIAIKMTNGNDSRMFIVEADIANRRVVPLSYYEKNELHVMSIPREVSFFLFSHEMISRIGSAEYGIFKAVEAGIRRVCYLPRISASGEICSEFCFRMWKMGGFKKLNHLQLLLAPDVLEKELLKAGVEVRVIIKPK